MKIKHRALALILSAIMVLTYMPALAFAGGEDSADEYYWSIEYTPESHILPGGKAKLTAEVSIDEVAYDEAGMDYPDISYSWYKCDVNDDGEGIRIPIGSVTGNTYETGEVGEYICVVTDDRGNEEEANFTVWERETKGGWYAYDVNEGNDYYLSKEGKATLSVMVEPFEGELPDNITYTWYIGTIDEDSPVEGANGPSFEVDEAGEYTCLVSDGTADNDKCVNFRVYEYQEEYSDIEWDVYSAGDEDSYYLQNGSVTLSVETYYYGEGTPTYTYQWCINGDPINGATGASYVAKEAGEYTCEVEISVNGAKAQSEVSCDVYSWQITNDEQSFPVEYGKSITLTAKTDYKGTKQPAYQWGTRTYDPQEDEDVFTPIDGADDASYTVENVTEEEEYLCEVTIDGVTQTGWYYVSLDYSKYEWIYPYPDAVAEYETHDSRPLTAKYFYDEEEGYDRCELNFPKLGDKVIMTSGDHVDEYVCISEDDEDDECFVNVKDEDEYLEFYPEKYTADASSGKINASVYAESIDHVNKKKVIKYDKEIALPVSFESDVNSIKFEPASISVYSEDIKNTKDGYTYYSLYRRNKEGGMFVAGDKLTVTYTNGTTRVFTGNSSGNLIYRDSSGTYYADPDIDHESMNAGNNTVKLYYQGRVTSINVFMDTPQMRDERARAKAAADAKAKAAAAAKAKEAARQGTPDSKIAKVKISKPKAAKKAVTAKWKKLSSKQIKKGKVKKYEIWVCPNKAFGASDTIMKEVSKSKSSGKVKVPKKGTYYVKVRAIRKAGGVKYVGKWSSPKKVKVKK